MSRFIAGDEPSMSVPELLVRLEQARADREALLVAATVVIVRNEAAIGRVESNVESAILALQDVANTVVSR